jgi:hypothetical protein
MLLKRIYDRAPDWEPVRNVPDKDGNLPNPARAPGVLLNMPPLKHLEVRHTGTHPEQNFSSRLVAAGLTEGWITLTDETLTLHAHPEDLVYTILAKPGRTCLHCLATLPDDIRGELARAHVAAEHPDTPSPDPANPAGYEMISHYRCVLDEAQHTKYKARAGGGARG